jgi:hypothetical protein
MEYISISSAIVLSTAGLAMILQNIANKHVNLSTKIFIMYFWICSFLPFLLVPLDFTFFNHPQDSKRALGVLWKIYYFLNLVNGQLLLPLLIAWVASGYVLMRERIVNTVIEVFVWIGIKLAGLLITVIIGVVVAIYGFDVQVNVMDFLVVNSINWLNTSLAK